MEQRRVTNRVQENTIVNSENALKYFDGDLGISRQDARVFHNDNVLEEGKHYEFLETTNPVNGDKVLSLKLLIQLQPNDRFYIE